MYIGLSRGQNTTGDVEILGEESCPKFRNGDVTLGGPHCCDRLYRLFRTNYFSANTKLTNLLEKLRAWNCSQFEVECENRYFQFNCFTSLIYDRFCNQTAFAENCRDELNDINAVYNLTGPG